MAIITSGASADTLTIDPISKAARTTLYDSSGNEIYRYPTGSYSLDFVLGRFTAAMTGGSVFAMRNGATRTIYIRKINLWVSFDGVAAASTQIFNFRRFGAATPSGGTPILASIIKKDNAMAASAIADARYVITGTTPLTVTSVIFEQPFCRSSLNRNSGAIANYGWKFFDKPADQFVLAANEGIDLLISVTAVVGDVVVGNIEWDEI